MQTSVPGEKGKTLHDSGDNYLDARRDGGAFVVPPLQGGLAILSFRAAHFHEVAMIREIGWHRYSIASHFSAANKDVDAGLGNEFLSS